jgi:hypothetical protein
MSHQHKFPKLAVVRIGLVRIPTRRLTHSYAILNYPRIKNMSKRCTQVRVSQSSVVRGKANTSTSTGSYSSIADPSWPPTTSRIRRTHNVPIRKKLSFNTTVVLTPTRASKGATPVASTSQIIPGRLVSLLPRNSCSIISDEFKSFFCTIFFGCSRGLARRRAVAPSRLRVPLEGDGSRSSKLSPSDEYDISPVSKYAI